MAWHGMASEILTMMLHAGRQADALAQASVDRLRKESVPGDIQHRVHSDQGGRHSQDFQ